MTRVITPSSEQIEAAWFNLMQGELGIEHDWRTRGFVQGLVDHLRGETERGVPITDAEGEPIGTLTSGEVARRVARAYAALFYS